MSRYWTDTHCPVSASVSRHCDENQEDGEPWEDKRYRLRCTKCGRFFSSVWHGADRCIPCFDKAAEDKYQRERLANLKRWELLPDAEVVE